MHFIAIKQLLQKLFFLGHKENVGEKPIPPSSLDSVLWFLNFSLPSVRRQLMFLHTWNTPNIYHEWHARQLKLSVQQKD